VAEAKLNLAQAELSLGKAKELPDAEIAQLRGGVAEAKMNLAQAELSLGKFARLFLTSG
jgi:hypothetical protein